MSNRLKWPLFMVIFLLAGAYLPAQDDVLFDDGGGFPELNEESPDYGEIGEEETPEKKKFRFKNRTVEMSVANTGLDFSNNFIAALDIIKNPFYLLVNINDVIQDPALIWRDPIVINLDHFFDGFKFNFGASIKPLSFNFNWKDKWGFGLDIAHIDITGNMSLSGNLVTFSEAGEDKFGVGGAVFVEAGIPVFFHYRDFKIKVRPAVYLPVVYTEPKVTYTFTETDEGTRFEINYDMRVYSLVSMEDTDVLVQNLLDNAGDIPNHLGYDFGLSVEYPWRYDIDIGVNVTNIPVPYATARLNHYMRLNGSVWVDTGELNVADLVVTDEEGNAKDLDELRGTVFDYPEEFTPEYDINTDGKKIYRPFAMVFYAHYRPDRYPSLTLIPSLGFSINYLYPQIAAVEGGISARLDANTANVFITTLGINYNDRRWINSVDFILNLRACEFDMGISFQSQNFARSWQGAGLSVNLGMRFGW